MVRRTVDLLPEIFRTDTNKKFLAATLDQLTQEPRVKKTYGYVGRRIGPGVDSADTYVTEPTADRADYQLEPGVVFYQPGTTRAIDAITYPGIIDSLNLQGGNTERQDRLFESQYYTWDPFVDLDKLVNYSQYYWIPTGPDSVDISKGFISSTDSWDVSRVVTAETQAYQFSDIVGNNPPLTLVRGGTYEFNVNQQGNGFWIQVAPGVNGRLPTAENISSRDVLGVTNNGASAGTITFTVPAKDAQEFYYTLADAGTVDLVTDLAFDEINNIYVDDFQAMHPSGIDGITNLDGRTLIFEYNEQGWEVTTFFDPLPNVGNAISGTGSYDTTTFSQTTPIVDPAVRYSVWQIRYINDLDGRPYMQLVSVQAVDELSKLTVLFGNQWSRTSWYKNTAGSFEKIPLLTAILDTLWYQDSNNPELFGRITLIEQADDNPLDLNDIIGAKNYISPNGVIFTNGLKVQLRGLIDPPQYQNLEFYVEGVGTGPGIDARVGFIAGEAYFGPWHYYQGQKMTGSEHSEDVFQQFIYDTVGESLANPNAGLPEGAPLPNTSVPGAAYGNGIRLIPVTALVTPEPYTKSEVIPYDSTPYDALPFDSNLNAPTVPDYITINRAARDLNGWTRSNRWFHIDVINATAEYNNTVAVLDNNFRAKRPIVEFRAGIELYNFGTQGKTAVNIIDFNATDAFSNINGSLGYTVDGYTFLDGTRVIFAADADPEVRNRIYEVNFIDPDGSSTTPKIINLTPVFDSEALLNQTVVCLNGLTLQGKSFWYDGVTWQSAQDKSSVNQAPLFNVRDAQGISFDNPIVYPSSTFSGSRLFGYALGGTSQTDSVLGFALKYLNIDNIGDILFENYLYTDTFLYVRNNESITENISEGFVRQYVDRIDFSNEIGWLPAAGENRSRQVFRFNYDGTPLVFDVPPAPDTVYPVLQIFIDGIFIDPNKYTITSDAVSTTVTFTIEPPVGAVVEAELISDVPSKVAYYQVPLNLENNPLNENSTGFTLGSIRNHYNSIGQNLKTLQGPINGANNTRDLGQILVYGDNIVQHSAPLALTGAFLRRQQYEIFNALRFNSQEYEKFKNIMMDLVSRGDFVNNTPTQILDQVLTTIAAGKNELLPFYWSDMIPSGETYIENTYTYTIISTPVFDTVQVYDFTTSNYQGLLVYLNGTLLTKGYDYEVGVNSPTVTITAPLVPGDIVVIREYSTTYGSYVPNTPTKMGLYPAFRPQMFEDTTSTSPVLVIQGHDGSITRAFGDYRDDVLLEFETRIFDNLKIQTPVPIDATEVIPGQFRTTEYTADEVNEILGTDFLSWVGWNKIDYTSQAFLQDNQFTYNYSQSADKLNNQPLLGAWRGIYEYFYDTTMPNTRPWEMLGFSQEPDWWQDEYGPAPYTNGNLVLWEDLEAGIVRDPAGTYILPQYIRPGLTRVIPSDSEGNLLSPLAAVAGNYDGTSFRRSWAFGDGGPVESSWKSSSSWPFAVMRLLALTKPAKFFSLFADRDRYVFDPALDQYLWDGRYRLDATRLDPLYGNGVSKASYINWIIDYNRQLGSNSTANLETFLDNVGVRLCWRLAAFSDKKYLKIYTERSTPNSANTSLLLPDESYQLLLYKNQPFERSTYSSVIVQKTDDGYAVLGYSSTRPYFEILVSRATGLTMPITVGSETVRVPVQYSSDTINIPYGYVFTNRTAVCDFLLSYGQLLDQQGFTFENRENGYVMNWMQMAQEFLYWDQQGWGTGAVINLNPTATSLSITRPGAVAESIAVPNPDNIVLNQNRQAVSQANLVINRLDNTFQLESTTSDTINFIDLRFTSYEHIVILDNVSIFADLIYDPATGARQSRVLVSGYLSADWNGTLNAPGFVLNQDNIVEWVPNKKYAKGEIVLFKNEYWSASTIIQPSERFDYTLWLKSDYNEVQKGLLPNAANVSDQLAAAYNVYSANLEEEVDLFSYGLIGFRPREYMQALNLDDVSQVGLYQQFLGDKGTLRSAELFSESSLRGQASQYDIYEYWAMLRSQYGATANRSYFELLLDEAKLKSDPSLIQVIAVDQSSQADQTVLVNDIWKSSYRITSPNILPTTTSPVTDIGLPTAGYVNLDDVDLTVFDIDDPQTLNDNLASIGVGTTIWAAKVNAYDWNIYRTEVVPGVITQVSDNLEGRALVTFSKEHGLAAGNFLIIRFFNGEIDGVYRVRSVPTPFTVLIDYTFTGNASDFVGNGVGFTLQSVRVAQASDILNLPYSKELLPGARVWVDNNGNGRWTVLEKTNPFSEISAVNPSSTSANQYFGSSVAQGFQISTAMVGAPGYANGAGAVYVYDADINNKYSKVSKILTLGTTGTVGFGNAVAMGDQSWAVVGATSSNSNEGYAVTVYNQPDVDIRQQQLLVSPDYNFGDAAEFGYSVAISQDERWLYVGAPGRNRVYAYGRVDVESQSVTYVTRASTTQYALTDAIVIDDASEEIAANQLYVTINGIALTPPSLTDSSLGQYEVIGSQLFLAVSPGPGQELVISRRQEVQLDTTLGPVYDLGNYLYTITDIFSFSVELDGVLARPEIDYTFNALTKQLTLPIAPGVRAVVSSGTHWKHVATINADDDENVVPYARFGHSISTTADGRQIMIGCPAYSTVDTTTTNAGSFDVDVAYKISVLGDTDWTAIGASATPVVGEIFVATGPGNPATTGKANEMISQGAVFVYDRSVQRFQVTPELDSDYTTALTPLSPVSVSLNGNFLTNSQQFVNGQFTVSGNVVTLENVSLAVGDTIEVETNEFSLIQRFQSQEPSFGAGFGYAVAQCVNNCSLYAGAPFDSTNAPQSGVVEYLQNRARIYGSITTTNANPVLVPGEYIRIDDVFVQLSDPAVYDISQGYTIGSFVRYNGNLYQALQNVPAFTVPGASTVAYWKAVGWIQVLISDINKLMGMIVDPAVAPLPNTLPNVSVSATSNLEFVGDGSTKKFNVGTIYSSASSYNTMVLIDGVPQTAGIAYTYDNDTQEIEFLIAPGLRQIITVVSGRMTFSIKNFAAAPVAAKIQVSPVAGNSMFDDLGLQTYINQQVITSPVIQDVANFGASLAVSSNSVSLAVGAPNGSTILPTIFDSNTTTFDSRSTTFADPVEQSGAVYVYNLLPAANSTETNPAQVVFGQQVYNQQIDPLDKFGTSVSFVRGKLLAGAPITKAFSTFPLVSTGQVGQFINASSSPAWAVTRTQQPVVDISLMNSVFMYDRVTNAPKQYFDYFNPQQGRVLGAVRQNLDYIGAVDPAAYNVGDINNFGQRWSQEHVGQIWWNTNNVRFLDTNQDDIVYASRRWGQTFPGSAVDVYQWVESSVPPVDYTGPGTPFNDFSYSVVESVNESGFFVTTYYFWVTGISDVNRAARKTLSVNTIARYIESPRSSGISYIAPINASTIAIYNGLPYISAMDTILHVEFDQEFTENAVHVEYQLIPQDRADGFLAPDLYQKLQDSFSGIDRAGNPVPDPFLSPSEKYGVAFRPRQSLFENRFLALKNYLVGVNKVLAQFPITESRSFNLLDSEDPEPSSTARFVSFNETTVGNSTNTLTVGFTYSLIASSRVTVNGQTLIYSDDFPLPSNGYKLSSTFTGTLITFGSDYSSTDQTTIEFSSSVWNKRLADYQELGYQNLAEVPLGYRYLVQTDSTNNGLWTIYEVAPGVLPGSRRTQLVRVQNYDTKLYWNYINWYQPGYNPLVRPVAEVPVESALETLNLPEGSTVKVTRNARGKFEIYQLTNGEWIRVGLQDGTIEISAKIWDYSIGRFGFDVEVFDAQYYDQEPTTETRKIIQAINEELLIDDLLIERNRLLILMFNYILSEQEAPTWLTKTSLIDVDHTIRNLEPTQNYQGDNQDFVLNYIQEVKPYHVQIREFNLIYKGLDTYLGSMTDFDLPAFWDPSQQLFISPVLDNSIPPTLSTTSSFPSSAQVWQDFPWNQWYQNYLMSLESVQIINGGSGYTDLPTVTCGDAELLATINSFGQITSITVINPGSGFLTTPTVTITGGGGSGAIAYPILGNSLVRSVKTTIKYDRYEYQSTIIDWQPNVLYTTGTQVRFADQVWAAIANVQSTTFDPDQWTLVPAESLSGVNRTMGYYVPRVNEPGLDLALLISGVDYPGVQVFGVPFDYSPGFDVGNYDIAPFDNIFYGPEGQPTYDPAILDAIYESNFVDPYLGVGPAAIDVDGGAFVDTYSSHAPEELVPGAIFDTLDMRVFATPGSDWTGNGHGFGMNDVVYVFSTAGSSYSFINLIEYPVSIAVYNKTTGVELSLGIDYTVNWVQQTVKINSGATAGDLVQINAYSLGGGNQLFRNSYIGSSVGDTIIVPISDSRVEEFVVFVNGQQVTNFVVTVESTTSTRLTFTAPWAATDYIVVTAIALTDNSVDYSWSTPVTEYFTNVAGETEFTLANFAGLDNPDNAVVNKNGQRGLLNQDYVITGQTLTILDPAFVPTLASDVISVTTWNDTREQQIATEIFIGPSYVTYGGYDSGPFDCTPVTGQLVMLNANIMANVASVAIEGTGDTSQLFVGMSVYANGYIPMGTVITSLDEVQIGDYDPLPNAGNIISGFGSYDTTVFDLTNDIVPVIGLSANAIGSGTESVTFIGKQPSDTAYNDTPGSFDYPDTFVGPVNKFTLGSVESNPDLIANQGRLIVTLNGRYLFESQDFDVVVEDAQVGGVGPIVPCNVLVLYGPIIEPTDVLIVTSFTNSVVPGAVAFRIFQDMRGLQSSYRITESTTTTLVQPLSATDTVIYVEDASKLSEPDLENGVFGLITIDGERITYRTRDTVNNTLSGLRRGTVGTAADSHGVDSYVYDIGAGNLLPEEYQDRVIAQNTLGDGTTETFLTAIPVLGLSTTYLERAVEVYLGGILQTEGYSIDTPIIGDNEVVSVTFDTAPTAGYQVSIRVRRGQWWYDVDAPGQSLQETNTAAARFIRGE